MRRLTPLILALGLLLLWSACAQPAPTATPTARPAQPPAATATTQATQVPTPAALTAGQRAELGKAIYQRSCGICHDQPFAGGLALGLKRFDNAQQQLNYARTAMPQNAPGSLPLEDYLNVLTWVWVDNKVVASDAVLDVNALSSIVFKK